MDESERKTILLVEDEAILAMVGSQKLKRFGYDVVVASSGEKAVRLAEENPKVDLVLMDIDLGSGIDGAEAARRILASRLLPVVFLTVHEGQEAVEKVSGIKRFGYVIKSSGDFVLRSSIEMALELFQEQEGIQKKIDSLYQSETYLALMMESSRDGILVVDNKGKVTRANRRFCELWRIPESEIGGGDDRVLLERVGVQLSDPEAFLKKVKELYVSGDSDEDILYFKDGRVYERFSCPMMIGSVPVGRLWSFRDISERKRSEEALQNSRNFIGRVLDTAPNIIYINDISENRNVYVNREVTTFLGYSQGQIQSSETNFLQSILHPDDLELMSRHYGRFIAANERDVFEVEYRVRHADGSWRWLHSRDVVFSKDKNGRGRQILGSAEDITEKKRAADTMT